MYLQISQDFKHDKNYVHYVLNTSREVNSLGINLFVDKCCVSNYFLSSKWAGNKHIQIFNFSQIIMSNDFFLRMCFTISWQVCMEYDMRLRFY